MAHDRGTRRRAAAGAAVAATAAVGMWAAPAGAAAPSAHADCTYDSFFARNEIMLRLADFPPGEPLHSLITITGTEEGASRNFSVDIETPTYGDGSWPAPAPVYYEELPVTVGWIVYRDTNGNSRWDDEADETLYRGSGSVTACPQSVTLSPK